METIRYYVRVMTFSESKRKGNGSVYYFAGWNHGKPMLAGIAKRKLYLSANVAKKTAARIMDMYPESEAGIRSEGIPASVRVRMSMERMLGEYGIPFCEITDEDVDFAIGLMKKDGLCADDAAKKTLEGIRSTVTSGY